MRTTFSFLVMTAVIPLQVAAQTDTDAALRYLRVMPWPAKDIAEALDRCPGETDTLMQTVQQHFSRMTADSGHRQAGDSLAYLQQHFLDTLRVELEGNIRSAGEMVDAAIRDCRKVADNRGRDVYDPSCVAAAEQRGYATRVGAVRSYLSRIHAIWPEYLSGAERLIAESRNGKWHIISRVAGNIATITATAAQFSR